MNESVFFPFFLVTSQTKKKKSANAAKWIGVIIATAPQRKVKVKAYEREREIKMYKNKIN